MKLILLLIILTGFTFFTIKPQVNFGHKAFKKSFSKIKNDLYVSKYETSNLDYRNFLADLLKTDKTELYKNCLPDTISWKDKMSSYEPFVKFYFRHPSYENYPVVGISFESANEYCTWLTDNYNKDPERKFKKVIFTLPSKDDWMFAANKGDASRTYPWGSGYIQNNRKDDLCNYRHAEYKFDSAAKRYTEIQMSSVPNQPERRKITAPVKSYFPNSFGLYNMSGNVAEMISEKGIAMGGSYEDPAYRVTVTSETKYTKPTPDIGFRVAMKVLEE